MDKGAHSESSPGSRAKLLLSKGLMYAAKYVRDLLQSSKSSEDSNCQVLSELLDIILNPDEPISQWDMINSLKWFMAAGDRPGEFFDTVRYYDRTVTCYSVWPANVVAYRCRTCGISNCMSLCDQCFKEGDHEGHDFNMFKSQAGGACDCGNDVVMRETGFCHRHGSHHQIGHSSPPPDLLTITEAILPRVFLRFLLHCRDHGTSSMADAFAAMEEAGIFLDFLKELSRLGDSMRTTMTRVLCNPMVYKKLFNPDPENTYYSRITSSDAPYKAALESIHFEVPRSYEDIPTLNDTPVHKTILDEIVFWTVKFEFPQRLVCFLITMRPDQIYEEAFARAFVQHYSRLSLMLVRTSDVDTLSNRVVHVSVQLFSNQLLTMKMMDSCHLLYVMIVSLKNMMQATCEPYNTKAERNSHRVVNCAHQVMKKHCYWPLVSDLGNIFNHKPVAEKFINDPRLVNEWFSILTLLQGMNMNVRELSQHVEMEPHTYYGAFSAESEASASTMWTLVCHLKDYETRHYTMILLRHCLNALANWFKMIGLNKLDLVSEPNKFSLHLPLHRNFAVFLCQAVKNQGAYLENILPSADLLKLLVVHPLRVQVAFYEIISGLWVRNGLQIRGQIMTYSQMHFCNSMIDADLFLLQIGAGGLPSCSFLNSILERFLVYDTLSLSKSMHLSHDLRHEAEQMRMMLEASLQFLALLATVRTNSGVCEKELSRLEMVTLLCMKDKTHSELVEFLPIKKTSGVQNEDFQKILDEVSIYTAPKFEPSGMMKQGMFCPRDNVWEELYDPIYVLLRDVDRSHYQNAFDRFKNYCKQKHNIKSDNLWPPYRLPSDVHSGFRDPRRLIACRTFHAVILILLYKALNELSTFNENLLSLTIYLLELVIDYEIKEKKEEGGEVLAASSGPDNPFKEDDEKPHDGNFDTWFCTDDVFYNSTVTIETVYFAHSPPVSSDSDTSDVDMEELPSYPTRLPLASASHTARPLLSGNEVVPYREENSAVVRVQANTFSPDTPSATGQLSLPPPEASTSTSVGPSTSSSSGASSSELVPVEPRIVALSNSRMEMAFLCPPGVVIESRSGCPHPHRARRTRGSRMMRPLPSPNELRPAVLNLPTGLCTMRPCGPEDEGFPFGESIISLLLKHHSKLTGRHGSYLPSSDISESRIGDGPFFIAKVLDKLSNHSPNAKQVILETRAQLYPSVIDESTPEASGSKVQEERRRKAKERQKKIMAEFSQKQKFFMKNWDDLAEGGSDSSMDMEEEKTEKFKSYDCVICNQSIPSTPERPVGLVILIQASSVLGHQCTTDNLSMPTSDLEAVELKKKRYTLGQYIEERAGILNSHFDLNSRIMSMNIGWDGGVHIQTCGHHLHLDCQQSYLQSLRSPRANTPTSVKGDYQCPLCRQLANSVLPISPEIGELSSLVQHPSSEEDLVDLIDRLLKEMSVPQFNEILTTAMARMMETMTTVTYAKYRTVSSIPSATSLFMFVSSILRSNLEVELIQKKGTLIKEKAKNEVKRSCILPLLHVLGFHCKVVQGGEQPGGHVMSSCPYWIQQIWSCLTQRPTKGFETAIIRRDQEIPMLFKDPLTVLLQIMILLPSKINREYMTCIICNTYRLMVVKAAVASLIPLSEKQREQVSSSGPLAPLLSLINNNLKDTPIFRNDQAAYNPEEPNSNPPWSINDVTCQFRELCLHFLRIASLFRSHILEERIPDIVDPLAECGALEQYLGLWDSCSVVNTAVMSKMCEPLDVTMNKEVDLSKSNKSDSLDAPSCSAGPIYGSSRPAVSRLKSLYGASKIWCTEVALFAMHSQVSTTSLLTNVHFFKPKLLRLPKTYDPIFQYYHKKQCVECNNVPKDPLLCLICGTLVCMREACCEQRGIYEATQHSIDCGAGTGIYLYIQQSTIVVVRGPRVCLWGCVHLDLYGEEDKDLKRGKPLYLTESRYNLLEEQWICHSLDRITGRKWTFHHDRF